MDDLLIASLTIESVIEDGRLMMADTVLGRRRAAFINPINPPSQSIINDAINRSSMQSS
jgi:hypothetical protein